MYWSLWAVCYAKHCAREVQDVTPGKGKGLIGKTCLTRGSLSQDSWGQPHAQGRRCKVSSGEMGNIAVLCHWEQVNVMRSPEIKTPFFLLVLVPFNLSRTEWWTQCKMLMQFIMLLMCRLELFFVTYSKKIIWSRIMKLMLSKPLWAWLS